jgi:hypothetical protein
MYLPAPAPQVCVGFNNSFSQFSLCVLESLKRAFAEAHRNHLQSASVPSGAPHQSEPQSSVSLPEQPSKRRKTSVNVSPLKSSSIGTPNKARVTYGKRSKTGIPSSPSKLEFDVENGMQPTRNSGTPENWALKGTLGNEWVQHDPNALFPEPSSTVPNATLTQQRILETVMAPALLGLESEVDLQPYKPPPDGSVPWSDLMKFSPAATAEQSDPSNQQAEPSSITPLPQIPEQSQKTPSQRKRRGSSTRQRDSPLRTEMLLENVDPKDIMPLARPTCSSQDLGLPPTASKASHQSTPEDLRKPSRKQKSKVSLIPNSEDDLAAIGLPKEQYVPRPSRSRSLKVETQESVDFSVRPDKAVKATKRRKTTATASTKSGTVADLLATPEKIEQICEMGFTPKSTGRALQRNGGDVAGTVEWMITNGIGEDELAHNTPKRKSALVDIEAHQPMMADILPTTVQLPEEKAITAEESQVAFVSPVKPASMEDADVQADTAKSPCGQQLKSPRVQVVIPSKSPKLKSPQKVDPPVPSGKKAKRRKTTLDVPEPDTTIEPLAVPATINEKKKGRGRPKKTPNAVLPTDVSHNTPPDQRGQPGEVLQTPELDTTISEGVHNEDENAAMTATTDQISDVVQKQSSMTATVPKNLHSVAQSRTPEPSTKLSSESSATKGKASYRVGLSKRARIAPLLRTLKK